MKMYDVIVGQSAEGDFLWSVYENASEQIVETFVFEEDALKFKKFASNGGAFNGWTPSFMTRKNYKPLNLDDDFRVSFEIE